MKTPIFGFDDQSRGRTLAYNQLFNLYGEISEDKDGVAIGALYNTPGLDLVVTVGNGPIRAGGMASMAGTAYIISDVEVYSLSNTSVQTLIGSLPNPITTPVDMITNGSQMAIFDGVGGYLVPGGYPLTGGTVGGTMTGYAVGDTVNLIASNGTTNATAQIEVLTESGGSVETFQILTVNGTPVSGAFNPRPTQFSQASTDGSGAGLVITAPTYGPLAPVYTIPLPFTGAPGSATYQDGFGLVAVQGTQDFYQSNLYDLSIWDPLNFDTADANDDNIDALYSIHREIWVLKDTVIEVWINAGLAGFTFQRLEGVFPEVGIYAPNSVAKAGETLIWLAQTSQGNTVFVRNEGYAARMISTSSLNYEMQGYSTTTDAIAYVYQQSGHVFYVCTFPSAGTTWQYDVTTSEQLGIPCWNRLASFSNGAFSRHWGNALLSFNGMLLVGDYQNGNIYNYDPNTYTDNGQPRKWLRSWRALAEDHLDPIKISSLQISMDTGVNVPAGTNPQLVLRCSNDGGDTWPISVIGAAGKPGETRKRVKFNRLGSTRRNGGLTRLFELSSTDPFGVAIVGAEINV
jgi:hypothetical protein